jgi:Tol biopolymer transport system component
MKRCPECRKDYFDDSLMYCLDDGAALVQGSSADEPATAILSGDDISDEGLTKQLKADDTIHRTRSITFSLPAYFSGRRLAWVVACVLALVAAIFAYGYLNRPSNIGTKVVRLAFNPPPELSFNDVQLDSAVISPDGQKIAFSATANGTNMLYVRDLDSTEAKLLPGSENPIEPFWSPDSRSVAYGSNGKLKRSDLSGGNPQVLCDAARIVGGSWSKDGVIIFASDYRTRITQVSAKGGEPQAINIQSENIDRERHNNPIFIPDGRHFLYRRQVDDPSDASGLKRMGIWAGSLDSPEGKQVLPDDAAFAYTPEGWLVLVRNDTLVAQAFDTAKLQVSGEPIPIISGKHNAPGNNRRFSISDNGVLVWQGLWEREYHLTWFDREGKQTGVVGTQANVSIGQDPRLSPDGKRLLVKRGVPQTLWVTDLEKGTDLRLTSNFGQVPVWSPDGSKIAFTANPGLSIKASNGLGDAETLLPGLNFPFCWSPDGRFIIFLRRGVKTRFDMYALSLVGERKELPLSTAAFDEQTPQISPDGKWLAYSSDETGKYEIYVQSFSADGKLGSDRKLISGSGGFMPVWRRDGSELFFIAADGQMMVSAVKSGGSEFEFNSPKALFKTKMLDVIHNAHEFDVSPDGQRFLIGTLIGEPTAPPPTVILNWTSLLKNQ